MTDRRGPAPVVLRGSRPPRAGVVSLLRPPVVVFPRSLSGHGPVPPVGLAYLAAVLRDAGHHVCVVDGPGEALDQQVDVEAPVGTLRRIGLSPAEIVDRIDPGSDVIGISQMFLHEWPQARELAELVRERFPRASIVLGGDNATAYWPWIFEQCNAIDHVVLGEGEATILELVDRVVGGAPVNGLAGVVTRPSDGAGPVSGGLPARLRHLEEVPQPAWDLFPLDRYFEHADYLGVERGRSMPVLATRGCPYRCTFCSSPQMWTTRYVVRDPEDVADEIAGYVEQHGIRNVDFTDLTAITKRRWTLAFCDALDAHGLDLTWQLPVGTRAEALDAEVLGRLHDTGCRNVTYAPESGSERMLAIFDKRVDLGHVLTSIRHAHRLGLKVHVNTIIGHPDELRVDRLRTLGFLLRAALAGADTGAAIIFAPYPGSQDFDRLLAAGRLEVDDEFTYVGLSRGASRSRSYNLGIGSRALRRTQLAIVAAFYAATILRRPWRLVDIVRAQVSGREDTQFDQFLRIKRRGLRSLGSSAVEEPDANLTSAA